MIHKHKHELKIVESWLWPLRRLPILCMINALRYTREGDCCLHTVALSMCHHIYLVRIQCYEWLVQAWRNFSLSSLWLTLVLLVSPKQIFPGLLPLAHLSLAAFSIMWAVLLSSGNCSVSSLGLTRVSPLLAQEWTEGKLDVFQIRSIIRNKQLQIFVCF